MKYVIYARVSTTYDSQESSFDVQTKELKKKIKILYPSYTYLTTYGDQGISGKKEDRPQFQQMLQDARDKKFDVIVTKSISRFARNTRVLLSVLEELEKLNIKVLIIEENLDTSQANQKFILTVLGGLAEMEANNTSSHIRESNSIKRMAGSPARMCSVPVGYTWDRETKTVSINPDEAELVKQIYSWFVDDHFSQGKIAALATDAGLKPRHGALKIDRGTITKILKNKKYIGIAVETDSATGKVYEFDGVYPVIIDKTIFDQAQAIFASTTKSKYSRHERRLYPLSQICFCSLCNRKATRFTDLSRIHPFELEESSGGTAYWGCRSLSTNKVKTTCKTYKMSEEYIYEAIIEALVTAACGSKIGLEEKMLSKKSFNAFLNAIEESNKNFEVEMSSFESKKKDLEKQRKKELDLFRQDLIDEAELKSNIKVIDKKLRELVPPKSPETKQMNQEHLKSFLKAIKSSSKDFLKAQQECRKHLFELFKDKDFRRSIITTFVSKVWIGGDKFTITVELKSPMVSYTHRFEHRAPILRNGKLYREDFTV